MAVMGRGRRDCGASVAWVLFLFNYCILPSSAGTQEAFGACGSVAHSIRGGWYAPPIVGRMGPGGLTGSAQQWPKCGSWRGGCRRQCPKESMAFEPRRLGLRMRCPSPPRARLNIRGPGAGVLGSSLHGAKPVSRSHGLAAYGESSPHDARTAAEGDGAKDAVSTSVSSGGGGGGGGDGGGYIDGKTAAFTALASASILVSYADRGNLASAIVPMGEEFGWSPGFEGLVLSSFFLGYAATQMLGGWLADRYGGRKTLMSGLATWSVFTLMTPLAAAQGTTALLATRIGLGLGEGFAFPSVHAMIAENVRKDQQSTVVGCVTAASYAGALLAFSVSPAIMRSTGGWEAVFYAFGGGSLLLLPAWLLLPLNSVEVEPMEPENTRGGTASSLGERGLSLKSTSKELARMARHLSKRSEVWAIVMAQFFQSVGMYGLLSWLPTYLHDVRGLEADSAELGMLAAAPYAIQALVGAGGGLAADRLVAEQGWRVKAVRQLMQTAGMLGPAICLCAAVFESRADTSVAWIVLGSGMSAITLGGVSVNHLDISPKNAGLVFGAGNTAATIAGLVTVPLCGWLLETYDSWDGVFLLFASSYVLGALLFFVWVGDEEID